MAAASVPLVRPENSEKMEGFLVGFLVEASLALRRTGLVMALSGECFLRLGSEWKRSGLRSVGIGETKTL